ncbi:hypothetical protein ACB294_28430, partial [Klebsiella pneumoniae]
MRYRIYPASSLTDSLRSVVRLRRAEMAYWRGGNVLEDARKKLSREAIRPRRSRFSIGSAPLTTQTHLSALKNSASKDLRGLALKYRYEFNSDWGVLTSLTATR